MPHSYMTALFFPCHTGLHFSVLHCSVMDSLFDTISAVSPACTAGGGEQEFANGVSAASDLCRYSAHTANVRTFYGPILYSL